MREATARAGDAWQELKQEILEAREQLLADAPLLGALGLCPTDEAAVTHFGPVALSRVAAAHRRESNERQALEAIVRANFVAQRRTQRATLDLLGAASLSDLAVRLTRAARTRFGLSGAVIALTSPAAVPAGWRRLVEGQVDMVLGEAREVRLGRTATAFPLFGSAAGAIGSVALIRLSLWAGTRSGLLAFAAADPESFEPDMGADLLCFLARVAERCAERWPAP